MLFIFIILFIALLTWFTVKSVRIIMFRYILQKDIFVKVKFNGCLLNAYIKDVTSDMCKVNIVHITDKGIMVEDEDVVISKYDVYPA